MQKKIFKRWTIHHNTGLKGLPSDWKNNELLMMTRSTSEIGTEWEWTYDADTPVGPKEKKFVDERFLCIKCCTF